MTNKEQRQSNFELLRILAMLMIVASHYASHGIEKVLVEGEAYVQWAAGGAFQRAFTALMNPGGEVGVALLFMITGYFQIKKDKVSWKKLVLTVLFYSLFAMLLCLGLLLAGGGVPYMSGQNILTFFLRSLFMPLTSTAWWFVAVYVFLMLLSPVFNRFLLKLNRKGFLVFLLVFWGVWYGLAGVIGTSFFELQKALFFYGIGAFIRIYRDDAAPAPLRCGILALLAWVGTAFCFLQLGKLSTAGGSPTYAELLTRGWSAASSMLMVPLCAVCAFMLFKGFAVSYSGRVNRLASTTFGIYLIHDSLIGRPFLWYSLIQPAERQYPSPLFALWALLTILAVFAVCALIDLLRQKIFLPPMERAADGIVRRLRASFMKNP